MHALADGEPMEQKKKDDVQLRPPKNPADRGTSMDPEVNLRDRSNARGPDQGVKAPERVSAREEEDESSD